MSSTKISALTAKTTPSGSEELLINDSGVSKKITIANLPDTDTTYSVGDGGLTQVNFTTADNSKLDAIEASADVTDTTNVTAAGALMDSEVTNLAQVKAFDTTDYATAAQGTTADAALPLAGGTMTGDVSLGDNVKAKFGASSDLQIYHDGSNSIVDDVGDGDLILKGSSKVKILGSNSETMASFSKNGAVSLFYDSGTYATAKLATTSTGIDVTGNVVVSGNVDGRDVATDGTKLDGIESGATADQTAGEIEAIVTHDNLLGFVANEHIDWTADQGATNIHSGNYTDTNTTYTSSDFTHNSLSGVTANEHIDWTTDQGATNIHSGNYTDTNTTYTSSDFTHDDLTGFVANEHIDWTTDQGATNVHAGNYTDTDTIYTHPTADGSKHVPATSTTNNGKVLTAGSTAGSLSWVAPAATYSLPSSSTTVLGGIKLEDDTVQATAANTVTATASRTYGVQVNSTGQGVVNVPWVDTDTDTVYTHPNHSGDVTSTADGATVISAGAVDIAMLSATGTASGTTFLRGDNTWVVPTDTNTTYTASTGITLTGTAFSIATDGVDSEHYAAGSIDNEHIADNAINSEHYAAGSIDNEHLADNAVGVAELSASGTASSSTYLRGDNSWAAVGGGGKVLQVATFAYHATSNSATTSSSFVNTLLVKTFTPTLSSSTILIFATINGQTQAGANNEIGIFRDSTQVGVDSNQISGGYLQIPASVVVKDSPATTSTITYRVKAKVSAGNYYYHINGLQNTLTIMEIGA